jgi:DNA sulfur modification protein DndB
MIHLACILGNLGYWGYYSTLMKVKDIVSKKRIITVAESEELYTNNINKVLQREISGNRIKSLSEYILGTDERFFSSLVVAIHKGNPKWTEIDISNTFNIEGKTLDDMSIDFLSSKFGVLSLSGDEQIFALDGQHRLKGLRKAFKDDKTIGELEIPVTFVIHNQDKLEKTRRLFTVLNKYAEKPKGAELIILDEDDAAAINTRRLVTEHSILSLKHAISNSKSGAIPKSDDYSFTTLVTINKINKILYNKKRVTIQKDLMMKS